MPIPHISTLHQLSLTLAIKALLSEVPIRQSVEITMDKAQIVDSLVVLPHPASLSKQVGEGAATFKICNGPQAKVLVVVVRQTIVIQHTKLPTPKIQLPSLRVNQPQQLMMTCSAYQPNYASRMKRVKCRKGKRNSSERKRRCHLPLRPAKAHKRKRKDPSSVLPLRPSLLLLQPPNLCLI